MDSSSPAVSSTTLPAMSSPTSPALSPASFFNTISHNSTTKLTRDNYNTWHFQMTTYLKAQQVYGFVNGTIAPPPQTIPNPTSSSDAPATIANPEFQLWVQQDQLVLSAILASLFENLISHVVGFATSYEVWQALERIFSSHPRARIMQVHFQLATIKKGGSSIIEYFQRFKSLVDSLATAGQPLNDFELISFLFAGLGSEFDPFVTSAPTRVDPMSLEDLYAHLLTHEMRLYAHLLTHEMRLEHNLQSTEAGFPSVNVADHSSAPKHKGHFRSPLGSTGNNSSFTFANRNYGTTCGRGRGKRFSSTSSSGTNFRTVCQV
jgi:hypothetical protein